MKVEELVGKTVAHKGATGHETEKRYTVTKVHPKFEFGSRIPAGPAVVIVRQPHGTESIRPAAKFLEEFEVVAEAAGSGTGVPA
jgi:hypothetical protein